MSDPKGLMGEFDLKPFFPSPDSAEVPGYKEGGWKEKYAIYKRRDIEKCYVCSTGACRECSNLIVPEFGSVYFVLRLDKDPHARLAMLTYAESVMEDNRELATDILNKIREVQR